MTKNDKRKFELNKSSEHDFDISKGSKRKFDLIKDEDNVVSTTTSSYKAEKAIETQVSEESNGSKKWIIWALIIVILALLAWWIFSGDNNSSDEQVSPETTEVPQEISADSVATAEDNVDDVTISDADAVPSEEEPGTVPQIAGQNSNQEQASASVADTPSIVTPNSSVTVSDDIEAEAMKVIRGDYGNNPNRKNVLGARYHDIQARVNQLMNK